MRDLAKIREKMKRFVDRARYKHCLSVEKTAVRLAQLHGVDPEKAALAAILHDCAKNLPDEKLAAEAERLGIGLDPFILKRPGLAHGFISAAYAKKFFGIKDKGVLSAISFHTTGRPRMNRLEKVIFVADHSESYRRFRGVAAIRRAAVNDLDRAIALISGKMIKYLEGRHLPVYGLSTKTRNYYRNKCK